MNRRELIKKGVVAAAAVLGLGALAPARAEQPGLTWAKRSSPDVYVIECKDGDGPWKVIYRGPVNDDHFYTVKSVPSQGSWIRFRSRLESGR